MPPKAPAAKPSKSRSPSPATKGAAAAAKGAPAKPAGSSKLAPPPLPSSTHGKGVEKKEASATVGIQFTHESASSLLQAIGRAFLVRLQQGALHKKFLAKKMEKESEDRIFAHSRLERQRRERQRKLQNEEESKEAAKRKLMEQLSAASFDGHVDEIKTLLQRGADIYAKDPQGNFALGEAAVNGQGEAVKLLLARGADPNGRGEYDRTPLWRAGFNNHTEVMRLLLEGGGDPRLRAQGQTPDELCGPEGRALISGWDVSKTDAITAKIAKEAADRDAKRREEAKVITNQLSTSADDLKTKVDVKKKELIHHKQEFEKRIVEYDIVNCDGTKSQELKNVALECVKTAERDIEATSAELNVLQEEYFALKTQLALHNHEELGESLEGTEFPFKKLADVVFEDSDNLWKSSGKWPAIFDPSGKTRTFLKYRNVIFVDTFSPQQMEKDHLRRSVLGALRYGKPLVLDLRDVPMLSHLQERFEQVSKGLFDQIVNKTILNKAVFLTLLRQPQDGPELAEQHFSTVTAADTKFVFISSSIGVDDTFGSTFAMLRVEESGVG